MIFVLYLVMGALAGTLSGLLGVGGGIIVVPGLILLFQYSHIFTDALIMHMAVGTSLAIMIFTTLSSAGAYYRRGFIIWPIFLRFIPGLCVGMIVGAMITKQLSSQLLITLFGIFLLVIALFLLFSKSDQETRHRNSRSNKIILDKNKLTFFFAIPRQLLKELLFVAAALLIGVCSTVFGIGGGLLMVPFFLYVGLTVRESSGTSSVCGIPIACIGTLILTLTGWSVTKNMTTPFGTLGFIYWPAAGMVSVTSILFAPIGTRLAVKLHPKTLKRILAGLLIINAINLLK